MTEHLNPFQHIKLEHLAPSPTNPRKHFDVEDLRELGETIAQHGVIEPIIVRCWPEDYDTPADRTERPLYEIIAGERRYRASMLAEMEDIPALVRHLDTRQVLEIQIIENLQRRGVNEIEEAEGYDLMMRDFGYTADQLAEKVGKSRAYIYGRLKLTALCEEARQAFRDGKLDASRALLIARIPGASLQAKALKDITDGWYGVMSYRQAANHIQGQYMRGLRHIVFALDDATLRPEAGPCTTCTKRPCNTPELYPDVPADRAADVCTDTECMTAKTEAHLQRQADAAAADGRQVVRGLSFPTFLHDYQPLLDEDHDQPATIPVDEDGNDLPQEMAGLADDHRSPTAAEVLQQVGAQVEIVLVEHPSTRELIECVRKADYRQAAPAPEDDDLPARGRPSEDAIKAETARRREIFTAIRSHYDSATQSWASKIAVLRVIAQQFWTRSWPCARETAAKLNGITPDHHGSITNWLSEASASELIPLLLDLALEPATDVPLYADDITTPAPLLNMARAFGIDPDDPKGTLAAAAETASTPEQAPPGGDDSAAEEPVTGLAVAAEVQAKRKRKDPPYCHPNNPDLTWSGRGQKPLWVQAWLEGGGTMEQLSPANQAAPAGDVTAETPPPESPSPAKQAAPAGAVKSKGKAAAAAKTTKEKATSSGRVTAAGGKKMAPDEPPPYRCPNTPDMLDGVQV